VAQRIGIEKDTGTSDAGWRKLHKTEPLARRSIRRARAAGKDERAGAVVIDNGQVPIKRRDVLRKTVQQVPPGAIALAAPLIRPRPRRAGKSLLA